MKANSSDGFGRRAVLKSVIAAAAGSLAVDARGQTAPLRFGVIADPQYAPVAPNVATNRYYANSLWKMQEAVAEFNKHDLAFVVTLGDVIDRHAESFGHILPIYDTLRHEKMFVLGNHDFEVGREYLGSIVRTLGMPSNFFHFVRGDVRFVVLDGNDVSLFAPPPGDGRRELAASRLAALRAAGAANAQAWNGSLGDGQLAWLDTVLQAAQAAGERVVVLNHYPVWPADRHNMWDSTAIMDRLLRFDNVVAFFAGHNHEGMYGEKDGRHFVTFRGMVNTPTTTAFAIVELGADRLTIQGFGREESRSFPLRRL